MLFLIEMSCSLRKGELDKSLWGFIRISLPWRHTLSHLKHFTISGITLRFYFMLADTDSGFKSMHSFILELDQ